MSNIAAEAGISKSLLFYYFRNKRELYMFLAKKAMEATEQYLSESKCYEQTDFFEIMAYGIKAKIHMMKQYPSLASFALKCYYEKDAEVCQDVQDLIQKYASFKNNPLSYHIDASQFIENLDIKMMYYDIYYASAGYIWEKLQQGDINVDEAEQDFMKMIEFWKSIYLRKEGSNECN